MELVVDANILFSALIKNDYTYKKLFDEKLNLYTPQAVFEEFEKHKNLLLTKTKRTTQEFYTALNILKKRIKIIPSEELLPYIQEAEETSPDPDDMIYFALALKRHCAIWTNDKALKNQNKIRIYHTHELP